MLAPVRFRYLVAMGFAVGCEPTAPAVAPTLVNEVDGSVTADAASVMTSVPDADSATVIDASAPDASAVGAVEIDAAVADASISTVHDAGHRDAGRRPPHAATPPTIPAEPTCVPRDPVAAAMDRTDRTVTCDDGRNDLAIDVALPKPFDRCIASYTYSITLGGSIRPTRVDATFSRAETTRTRPNRPAACCYVSCVPHYPDNAGRVLRGDDGARVASIARGDGWIDDDVRDADVRAIPKVERARLAATWRHAAQTEHASIASFARVSLQLLALGAPPGLIADTHAAAIDEIAHARAAFAIASRLCGETLSPDALSLEGVSLGAIDAATFATETFEDACVGETIAAVRAREDARDAPAWIARALVTIADDEERHAELAWRTLRWAIDRGGDAARARVRAALANATCVHRDAVATRVVREVIVPCAEALLDRDAALRA